MKRPLQLSLAIALALGGTNAMALGLGPVHVKSKLNQPLDAEIPVLQGTAGEAEGLLVSLAAAEDFERVGISRGHLNIPLDFSVGKGANGQVVIRVTSKDPVRDSYLDFLVEANWPKGRLLREYTVLLDPPVTAPARTAPATAVASAPVSAPAAKPAVAPEKERATEKPAKVAKVEKTPKPEKEAAPAHEAKPAAAAPRRIVEGEYGPTKEGETLSGIARAARPDGSVNMDQMMLALLKNNPNAFYKDNINALKRGAILRVPSADEAKAIGSASEAAAQVRSQIEDWRGGRATPTRVAATAEKPVSTPAAPSAKAPKASAGTASSKSPSERLELVPPKAGKDSIAMADQPGSGGSAGTGAETKRELARTKEALTARDQEAGELKSRVKELEDLKGKNDRLISLKDSEIADLQQKLKELQAKSDATAKSAPTKPATTPSAPVATATPATAPAETPKPAATPATSTPSTTPTIDKKDIWGDSASASAPGKPGEAHAPTTPATAAPSHEPASTAPTPAATTPPAPAVTTPSTSTPAGATSSTTPAPTTPPVASTSPASGATVTPLPASPPTTATTDTATKPVATTPAKKPAAPAVNKAPVIEPAWYEAPWVKPAALGGGVLLVLLGLLGMRKRKPATVAATRGSIADQFGDAPYAEQHGGGSSDVMEAEAASLRDQIARDPHNPGLYLELLSLYYAERDVARFEDTAAEMRAHVDDPQQPEWQEAQAMGQELAPHNPLFAGDANHDAYYDTHHGAHHAGTADTVEHPVPEEDDFAFGVPAAHAAAAPATHESEFGFGIGNAPTPARSQPAVHVPPVPAPAEDAFTFDDLPPLESPKVAATPAAKPAPMEFAPAMKEAPSLDDDFFSGEDAVGTKLDLAKAYMDMGDPDGARSMLEEVVAEGNDAQKAEAHRLIVELR